MSTQPDLGGLRVVLVRTRNPLNIGAVARAMGNLGFSHLRVVRPYEVAFREARSAVGAAEVLANAQEFSSVAEAIADCSFVVGTTAGGRRELQHALRPLAEGARLIRMRLRSGRVALLFGSEKTGLSNQDFSYCHWLMRVPTQEEHASMNLGQAAAICLYEIARSPATKKRATSEVYATSAELNRTTDALMEGLRTSGYVKAGSSEVMEEKIRRLVHRLRLSPEDNEILLGMLRKMQWKMQSGE